MRDYWGGDKEFPVIDWKYEVANDETLLGYWEWVANQRANLEYILEGLG